MIQRPVAFEKLIVVKGLLSRLHAPVYRKRLEVLMNLLLPWLEDEDGVLDVGCGSGQLGAELVKAASRKAIRLNVRGLERFPRGGEPIPVTFYQGDRFPFPDDSFEMVVLADVLHHEEKPEPLLRECVRVSKRFIAIKDHQLSGPFAKARVSLIDWAANAPYGVECLYKYNTPAEWDVILQQLHLAPVAIYRAIELYPPGFNFFFGRKLQYLAICRVPDAS